jgi:RsiW-degrading membrane proteinase PrsW (M82 family)
VVIFFYFFLSFFLPFIWIFYFYKKDEHPEPPLWLLFAFLLGILSAFLSYYLQNFSFQFVDSKNFWGMLLSVSIEEFFKFFLILLFIYPQNVFDEPIDAMIYMMFSAFGFAFVENIAILLNSSLTSGLLTILFLRFLGANLLHILASALIGYGYAFWVKSRRYLIFIISFVSGIILHFIYNYFIINLIYFFIIPILWTAFTVVLTELNYLTHNGSRGKNGNREKRGNINS